MKIIYMGTHSFAVAPLEALKNAGYDISLVVTSPDRRRDRGKKLKESPVKTYAKAFGLNVETPEKIKGNIDFEKKIRALYPDIIITAAYGKILPKEILEIPRLGALNIHGSLLPKYRGAAPIQRAVLNGEEETGVTLMYMDEGLDSGDIISFMKTPIGNKTSADLFTELSEKGAKLLLENLPLISEGKADRTPQTGEASYAAKIEKEEGHIDWSASPEDVARLVRALSFEISVYTMYKDTKLSIKRAEPSGRFSGKAFGTVLSASKDGIEVAARGGSVLLKTVQFPGKKAMDAGAFLLGNKIDIGQVLR